MNEPLFFSPMSLSDIPAVLDIEQESFSDPWSGRLFAEELDGDARRLNATIKINGLLIGYGIGWVVADEFHLGNLAVARSLRGRGYGRRLLRHMLDEASGRGCRICSLEVRASNQAAIGLYRSFGFRAIALRSRYYGDEDALVMLADLPVPADA